MRPLGCGTLPDGGPTGPDGRGIRPDGEVSVAGFGIRPEVEPSGDGIGIRPDDPARGAGVGTRPETGGTEGCVGWSSPGVGAGVGVSNKWDRGSGGAVRPERAVCETFRMCESPASPSWTCVSVARARISHSLDGSSGMMRATGFEHRGHLERYRPGFGFGTEIRCWQYGHDTATDGTLGHGADLARLGRIGHSCDFIFWPKRGPGQFLRRPGSLCGCVAAKPRIFRQDSAGSALA